MNDTVTLQGKHTASSIFEIAMFYCEISQFIVLQLDGVEVLYLCLYLYLYLYICAFCCSLMELQCCECCVLVCETNARCQ